MTDTPKSTEDLLRAAGLRVTRSRVALFELLHGVHEPVALDDVDLTRHPDAGDRATVFRNLHAFADAGMVSRIRGVGRRELYELAHGHRHAHITCVDCGKTECVEDAPAPPKKRVKRKGWSEVTATLSYQGRCGDCR